MIEQADPCVIVQLFRSTVTSPFEQRTQTEPEYPAVLVTEAVIPQGEAAAIAMSAGPV